MAIHALLGKLTDYTASRLHNCICQPAPKALGSKGLKNQSLLKLYCIIDVFSETYLVRTFSACCRVMWTPRSRSDSTISLASTLPERKQKHTILHYSQLVHKQAQFC